MNSARLARTPTALAYIVLCTCIGCSGKTNSDTSANGPSTKPEQPLPQKTTTQSPRSPTEENVGAKTDQPPHQSDNLLLSRLQFTERSRDLGLRFSYCNGEETEQFAILENLGGGVCIFDYDCDGWEDVLLASGGAIGTDRSTAGRPLGFFRNQAGMFELTTDQARFAPTSRYSFGVTTIDVDNDGFDDVLVTGFGGVSMMLNQGDGTFKEHADASLSQVTGVVTSAAEGDFNGDGFPDLYIATYVDWSFDNHPYCSAPSGDLRELCSPKEFSGTRDFLLLSKANGTFEQAVLPGENQGKGLGVLAVDFDQDADVDIYVANDTDENYLFVNQGGGKFEELGMLTGVALDERGLPNGSMGLSACDVDEDLNVDLWVANYERESFALYRNEENRTFLHTSLRYGISALGGLYVGFGTDWEDLDADGNEEIVVTNGHVLKYPTGAPRRQQPLLLSRVDSRFVVQSFSPGNYFSGRYEGRGLAVGDFNRDRRPDIVISHINENAALLINETPAVGKFVRIRLVGVESARCPIGATLVLSSPGKKQLRTVVGGGSYLSHNSPVVSFGVRNDTTDASLSVHWPSGIQQSVDIRVGTEHETVVIEATTNP